MFGQTLFGNIINIPDDYSTIQEGINASVNGDTVLVQPGTYIENINYNGKNIVIGSLFLTTQDTSYISQTIVDGNGVGSIVSFTQGENENAVLIGFTIKNGYLRLDREPFGIGIHITNSSPTIKNNIIEDNTCYLYNNGCGIGLENSSSIITENIIRNNNGAYYGSGIYIYQSNGVIIEYNKIHHNINESGLGYSYGGGICIRESNEIMLDRNLIYCNDVDWGGGGGIGFLNSSGTIVNNTITNNSLYIYGVGTGIYLDDNSSADIINTIIWDNTPHGWQQISGINANVTYCDIQDGYIGIGNIDTDPLFVDPNNGNYHLSWTNFPIPDSTMSPCIDAGNPSSPLDPDGTITDMGAFYFDQTLVATDYYNPNNIVSSGLYQNYPNPFNNITSISFALQHPSFVKLQIYNIKGQLVETIINENKPAGYHTIDWNALDMSSGIYFYKLTTKDMTFIKKMVLIR